MGFNPTLARRTLAPSKSHFVRRAGTGGLIGVLPIFRPGPHTRGLSAYRRGVRRRKINGRLESGNVCEYFRMMQYFHALGILEHNEVLYEMGIKEKEHEIYFLSKIKNKKLLLRSDNQLVRSCFSNYAESMNSIIDLTS